jgi:hypothetical protein
MASRRANWIVRVKEFVKFATITASYLADARVQSPQVPRLDP